jgi:hypothetical protein
MDIGFTSLFLWLLISLSRKKMGLKMETVYFFETLYLLTSPHGVVIQKTNIDVNVKLQISEITCHPEEDN